MTLLAKEKRVVTKKRPINKAAVTKKQKTTVDVHQQRHNKISEAAYHIAEQRGFIGQSEMDDWLQAEAEFDAQNVK